MTSLPESINLDPQTLLELELDGIALIEASAGTGKTHTIADLYLRHILAGRQPAQILVVTFTIAATEELRGRIRNRLYQVLHCFQERVDPGDEFLHRLQSRYRDLDDLQQEAWLRHLQFALRAMDEAAISTIHGFCQRCLQDFALAGGQFLDAELLSNDDSIWEDAIRDWWRRQVYALEPGAWDLLRSELPSLDELIRILLELRQKPRLRLLPEGRADTHALVAEIRDIAGALHSLAPEWQRERDQIVDILTTSKALSRKQSLPYKQENLDDFFAQADGFFGARTAALPFANFPYLATSWLDEHSTATGRGTDPRLAHPLLLKIDPIARNWTELTTRIRPLLLADAFRFAADRVRDVKHEIPALAFQDQLTGLLDALESGAGATLADRIRQQMPVALFDEFQDTDTTQYRIFRHIYASAETRSLTLIGDPKQAIYSFRGGDIFTYMQARRLSGLRCYSLPTNWRSHRRLVKAINTLFTHREDAFVYADSIAFSPVAAVADNDALQLLQDNQPAAAMTLWQLPLDAKQKNFSRDDMREQINLAIVGEIASLLGYRDNGPTMLGDRPLQSGDIAVLVRTTREGSALSQVLHAHGIRTVTIGRDSVFDSDEAEGLYELLLAIARYPDPMQLRRSLASSLLDLDYAQIAGITDHDDRWQEWLDNLAELQDSWQHHGFITMFQALLHRFEISSRLAQREQSERRLTNLLHLGELLHQQSLLRAGMSPLLAWFAEQFDEEHNEEAELRLENDEALVKIVTIHGAKGLQYPVVFVPFLWYCRQVDHKGPVFFHDAELKPCADLGTEQLPRRWHEAEKERLAEDLRLLYVALTRARAKVYLAWGTAGSPGYSGYARQTALAWLLHSKQSPADLGHTAIDGFAADFDFENDLDALIQRGGGSIERVSLPGFTPVPGGLAGEPTNASLQLAEFTRSNLASWRVSSFTALTRGVHQPAQLGAPRGEGDPILEFPAGSHIGLLLHSLLEHLDFQADIDTQCKSLLPRFLPGSGITTDEQRRTLVQWLKCITQTSLAQEGPSLQELSPARRLNELNFDFALDRVSISTLNELLQSLVEVPLQPLTSADFSGLVAGVIDLIFEHAGRYYFADYKSNFLGARLDDYAPGRLERAMLERRYDLQSLLYSVALHRYLGQRLVDYDYARDFGGSFYLFLRGLRPSHGHRFGVHFSRPELETLERLERLFAFTTIGEAES